MLSEPTKGHYTLIVPALDRTGPINVAVDIGGAAAAAGWRVRMLYLTEVKPRDDLGFAAEVRRMRPSDLWRLAGVVHTHCLRPDLLGFLLGWNPAVTLITTVHNCFLSDIGFDKKRRFVGIAWQLWKRALRRFDRVVCISQAMRRYYHRHLPEQPTELAYNFRALPPSQQLAPELERWIEQQRRDQRMILTFVGALSGLKNVKGLIDALASAPSLSLILCGRGPVREELDARVEQLGLQDRVHFAGHVLSPSSITQRTDALVLPSFTEGFPLVVIEAAAVGVPTLLSNIAVHRELARLGFGRTFDHRGFSDLETTALALRRETPAPSKHLIELWSEGFAPAAGFQRYEKLLSDAAHDSR